MCRLGSSSAGTKLTINGGVQGIVAASGVINSGRISSDRTIFNNASVTDSLSNAAIDAIFADASGNPLSLSMTLIELNKLRVGDGKLTLG